MAEVCRGRGLLQERDYNRDPRAMRLTTKGRYAVTAMLDIALHRQDGAISVADISVRQGISASYLEQLFTRLKRAQLLRSRRGPGGGYELAQPLESISVAAIVAAVGDGVDATRCHGAADCQDGVKCLTHDLWTELSQEIDGYLRAITLDRLVARSAADPQLSVATAAAPAAGNRIQTLTL